MADVTPSANGSLCVDFTKPRQTCFGGHDGCTTEYPTTSRARRDRSLFRRHLDSQRRAALPFLSPRVIEDGKSTTGYSCALLDPHREGSRFRAGVVAAGFPSAESRLRHRRQLVQRRHDVSALRRTVLPARHDLHQRPWDQARLRRGASLAMLVALIRDLEPQCYEAAEVPQTRTALSSAYAVRTEGAGKGSRIDLRDGPDIDGLRLRRIEPRRISRASALSRGAARRPGWPCRLVGLPRPSPIRTPSFNRRSGRLRHRRARRRRNRVRPTKPGRSSLANDKPLHPARPRRPSAEGFQQGGEGQRRNRSGVD